MVFWLSIALVPLFATEGRYLDLIWDKAVAALIGGCVAAGVAFTVAPIRLSRDFRPAVLQIWMHSMRPSILSSQVRGTAGRRQGPHLTAPTQPWTPWSRPGLVNIALFSYRLCRIVQVGRV